jgi:hypothetical protein
METYHMKPHNTSTHSQAKEAPLNTKFDAALKNHFQGEIQPEDNGFSQLIISRLPAQSSADWGHWIKWMERAQWTAIGLAGCSVAIVTSMGGDQQALPSSIALYALVSLLTFWTIPSRWSRGW